MFANELGWTSLELGPTDWLFRPLVATMLVLHFSLAWPKTVHLEKQKLHEIDQTCLCSKGILALLIFLPHKSHALLLLSSMENKKFSLLRKTSSFFIFERYVTTNNKIVSCMENQNNFLFYRKMRREGTYAFCKPGPTGRSSRYYKFMFDGKSVLSIHMFFTL